MIARLSIALALLTALAACSAPPKPSIYRETSRTSPQAVVERPAFPGYGKAVGAQDIRWTARTLADDFVQLLYFTEWGATSTKLLRWERPVQIAIVDDELEAYRPDVRDLVERIAANAPGLDLSLIPTGGDVGQGEITLRTTSREAMNQAAPGALCFFTPFGGDWDAFLQANARGEASWAGRGRLDAITIFMPRYAAPHEFRSCIAEEITQALGPGNDLERLEDSIYNDDNAHTQPTSFDLLMLRVLYDPAMRIGMGPEEARKAALIALSRPDAPPLGTQRRGMRIEDDVYLEYRNRARRQRQPARSLRLLTNAIAAAEKLGPADHRLASAHALAAQYSQRLNRFDDAAESLRTAERTLRERIGPDSLRLAIVRGELGHLLLRMERPGEALEKLEAAAATLAANGDSRRLAHTLRWRANALHDLGRPREAERAAKQALDWAGYVFGDGSKAARVWKIGFQDAGVDLD